MSPPASFNGTETSVLAMHASRDRPYAGGDASHGIPGALSALGAAARSGAPVPLSGVTSSVHQREAEEGSRPPASAARRRLSQVYRSCLEIKLSGAGSSSGWYSITPSGYSALTVYCDMTADGGGYTYYACQAPRPDTPAAPPSLLFCRPSPRPPAPQISHT